MLALQVPPVVILLLSLVFVGKGEQLCRDRYTRWCSRLTHLCDTNQSVRDNYCPKTCGQCAADDTTSQNNNPLPPLQCTNDAINFSEKAVFTSNSNDFEWRMYSLAKNDAPNSNVFFSPTSIIIALGMVLEGARGETRDQMKLKLLPDLQDSQISSGYAWLMKQLNPENANYQLHSANAMFVQQDLKLNQNFAEAIAGCFQSVAELRDFRRNYATVRQEINRWVEAKTNDKIKDLLPQGSLDALTRMVLVNAIYFKADWLHSFAKNGRTYDTGRFYPLQNPSQSQQVTMMTQKAEVPYYEDSNVQVLGLPYKDNELTMYIFLPRQKDGLPDFEAGLTSSTVNNLISRATPRQVEITIPKFKMTHELKLKKLLIQEGLTSMFGGNADLSGITSEAELYVSDAFHKAFIEVNEKGTEAAAATAIVIAEKVSVNINLTPVFLADHPFIFFIRHKNAGSFMFVGRFVKTP